MSKVDELKEKLNDFIETLKSKVPQLNKKSKEDDDYDDEEFDEDTGQVEVDPSDMGEDIDAEDATATDIGEGVTDTEIDDPGEDDDDDDDDDDEEEDEGEEAKKQKRKKLLIQGLLGVVILYLAADILLEEDETMVVQAPPKQQRKKPKKRRRNRKKEPVEQKQAVAEQARPKAEVPAKNEIPEPKVVENQPTEKPRLKVEPVATPTVTPTPVTTPAVVSRPVATPTPESKPAPEPEPVIRNTEEPKKPEDESVSKTEDATGIPPETPAKPLEEEKQVEMESGSLTMDDKVDQILKKSKEGEVKPKVEEKEDKNIPEEYVEPPSYKRLGRGLVYNCVGKHWACVDKFSYFQCRENFKWSKAQGKTPECGVKNVYASEKDCGIVQLHYINTREPTGFCDSVEEGQDSENKTKIMVQ